MGNTSSSRRQFLKTVLAAPAAFAFVPGLNAETPQTKESQAAGSQPPLPTRALGRSGRQVSIVDLGGAMSAHSPEYLEIAWSMGIRFFDSAKVYKNGESERAIAKWLAAHPERRKDLVICTKEHMDVPQDLLTRVDDRLATCGTDYLDILYVHGVGGPSGIALAKNEDFKKVIGQLKSSGKCRMVGFSSHDAQLPEILQSAAQAGFVDVILLKYNPFFAKGDPLDLGLDACHKAGIGLVAMKTMRDMNDVPKRLPEFDKMGLTVHQAKLQACLSDPRISSVCTSLENVDQMQASIAAARSYKEPLKLSHLELLRQTVIASRRTMCTGCPSCGAREIATGFALQDISRFVTYYEQDGNLDARRLYHALPAESRDASRIDLAALRDSCSFKTDYPDIIRRARQYFA